MNVEWPADQPPDTGPNGEPVYRSQDATPTERAHKRVSPCCEDEARRFLATVALAEGVPSCSVCGVPIAEHPDTDTCGAYWRDYGDHYSMCPVSTDNDPVEPVAVYERAARAEPGLRLQRQIADVVYELRHRKPGVTDADIAEVLERAALEAHGEPQEGKR